MKVVLQIAVRHWQAKLLAVVAAFGLWLIASSGAQRTGSFPGGIPLQFLNVPENFVAVADDMTVELILVANRSAWQTFQSEDFSATIDLGGAEAGIVDREVVVRTARSDVRIVRSTPSRVLVRLEPLETKSVPVEVRVEGEAEQGYGPGDVQLDPSMVTVRAPKSVLEIVDRVSGIIPLNGERVDFTAIVPLNPVISDDLASQVSVVPANTTARIPIVRTGNTKSVGITVVTEGELPPGRVITNLRVVPAVATVTGPAQLLSSLSSLSSAPLSLSSLADGETTIQLPIVSPEGIRVTEPIDEVATVTVFIDEVQSRRVLSVPVQVTDIPSPLQFSQIMPDSIQVVVTGGVDAIENLDQAAITLQLSAATLGRGENQFELSTASLAHPEGVRIERISPSTVTVVLESK